MVEVYLVNAIKRTNELVEAVETLKKENSRIADKNLHLQSEVDNLKKKLDIAGNRVDQLLTENDTLSEALKNAGEQLKKQECNFNSELITDIANLEREKCALHTENERLKTQIEILKNEALERLIQNCSFELKLNFREDE